MGGVPGQYDDIGIEHRPAIKTTTNSVIDSGSPPGVAPSLNQLYHGLDNYLCPNAILCYIWYSSKSLYSRQFLLAVLMRGLAGYATLMMMLLHLLVGSS